MEMSVTTEVSDNDVLSSEGTQKSGDVSIPGEKQDHVVDIEPKIKHEQTPQPTCVADIPGLRQLRLQLGVLLGVMVGCGLMWMATWNVLPVYLLHKVALDSSLLVLTIHTGFSFSILCVLVSDMLDFIWLVCLLEYLWKKHFQQFGVNRCDYITEVLMSIIICLTHVSLVLFVVCAVVSDIFLRYDKKTVTYTDRHGQTMDTPDTLYFICVNIACIVFKPIFYTLVEYFRIFLRWFYDNIDYMMAAKNTKRPVVRSQVIEDI